MRFGGKIGKKTAILTLLFFFFCKEIPITKTYLYNFDPLKPHFYIEKLGFTGVYIIFLISAQKHRLWVLVRTASPRNMKNIKRFLSENFSVFGDEISYIFE